MYFLSCVEIKTIIIIIIIKDGDTRELQSRMVPSQNNLVESP